MKKDKDVKVKQEEPKGGGFPVSAQGAAEAEVQPGDRVDGKVDKVDDGEAE